MEKLPPTGVSGKDSAAPSNVPDKLRADGMAFALQHSIYNLGANFVEPWIGSKFQRHHSGQGKYTQNLGGEFVGDAAGFASIFLAETFIPNQFHAFTRAARRAVDPLYTTAAHMIFADQKGQPYYDVKINQWKTQQERNLVRSSIMGVTNIAANVASQKMLFKNPAPTNVIFKGKLLSTALTTSVALAGRIIFPSQTKSMDRWVSQRVFKPFFDDENGHTEIHKKDESHAERVAKSYSDDSLVPAR